MVDVLREPLVLALDVATGWRRARAAQRALALLCPVLLAVWVVLALRPAPAAGAADELVVWELGYLLLGPPACSAAARVLRPYPHGPRGERPYRHAGAATGTAYGLVVVLVIALDAEVGLSDQLGAVYVGLATALAVVTSVWGVIAALARLAGAMAVSSPVTSEREAVRGHAGGRFDGLR